MTALSSLPLIRHPTGPWVRSTLEALLAAQVAPLPDWNVALLSEDVGRLALADARDGALIAAAACAAASKGRSANGEKIICPSCDVYCQVQYIIYCHAVARVTHAGLKSTDSPRIENLFNNRDITKQS